MTKIYQDLGRSTETFKHTEELRQTFITNIVF